LRREELATLAGISVDYYVRLEQGRVTRPSEGVLEALARALRLDPAEHAHLYDLARPVPHSPRPVATTIRPDHRRLLDLLDATPAAILGHLGAVLAWNDLMCELLVDFAAIPLRRRNFTLLLFFDARMRAAFHLGWESAARASVSYLRLYSGRYPTDSAAMDLVGELWTGSEDFRRYWLEHNVGERRNDTLTFQHATAGEFTLQAVVGKLALNDDVSLDDVHSHRLVVFMAQPGTNGQVALAEMRPGAAS
jgi:transcriptional regulator with XRE-family HTH domain